MELMARLAILVPPPYFPLTRYHSVFAASSKWRPLVTPNLPTASRDRRRRSRARTACLPTSSRYCRYRRLPTIPPTRPSASDSVARAVLAAEDDPTVITVNHWDRLLDGELLASS